MTGIDLARFLLSAPVRAFLARADELESRLGGDANGPPPALPADEPVNTTAT